MSAHVRKELAGCYNCTNALKTVRLASVTIDAPDVIFQSSIDWAAKLCILDERWCHFALFVARTFFYKVHRT